MLGSIITFIELGGIILAWMIVWNYLLRGVTAQHADNVTMQGLAAAVGM